jgi:hypothetical protein
MKLFITTLFAIALLSACGKKSEKTEKAPEGSAATPEEKKPEEKKPEETKPEEKKAEPAKAIISSCAHSTSSCTDYVDVEEQKKLCRPNMDGDLSQKPCPTAGLAGSCALPEGGSIRRYYTTGESPSTPADAETHCKNAMGGTFTAAK